MGARDSQRAHWLDNSKLAKSNERIPLVSPWRIAGEFLACACLLSWSLNVYLYLYPASCTQPTLVHEVNAQNKDSAIVSIVAESTGLAISVDEQNVNKNMLRMDYSSRAEYYRSSSDEARANVTRSQAFKVEWQPTNPRVSLVPYFCLRWLDTMTFVETVSTGDAARTLRVGSSLVCNDRTQFFSLLGSSRRSLFSHGLESFVQWRDTWHLRAHGDKPPWAPLKTETASTRFNLIVLPDANVWRDQFEARLLDLLNKALVSVSTSSSTGVG